MHRHRLPDWVKREEPRPLGPRLLVRLVTKPLLSRDVSYDDDGEQLAYALP
jgi:hypothetical protein